MVADESGHHIMLRKKIDGVTTVFTRMSHNDQEIRGNLIGLMARQCYLKAPEFWDLIDCPLSEKDWEKKIKKRSEDGRNPYIGQ